MKVTLANGMVLEGSSEQVAEVMEKMGLSGDEVFYRSGSKGLLLIKEMQSIHLRNAILKIYTEWVNSLHRIAEPKEVVKAIVEGIADKTWIAMVNELAGRDE